MRTFTSPFVLIFSLPISKTEQIRGQIEIAAFRKQLDTVLARKTETRHWGQI